jgi:hypothetical protein
MLVDLTRYYQNHIAVVSEPRLKQNYMNIKIEIWFQSQIQTTVLPKWRNIPNYLLRFSFQEFFPLSHGLIMDKLLFIFVLQTHNQLEP